MERGLDYFILLLYLAIGIFVGSLGNPIAPFLFMIGVTLGFIIMELSERREQK